MRHTATGFALLIAAVLAAVLITIGLYAWDTSARAAETALRPVPVAPLALVPQTPSPPLAVASAPAEAPSLPLAVASPPAPAPGLPVAVASPSAAAANIAGATGDPVAGARTFMSSCNSCHPSANAGIGPALYGPQFAQRYPEDGALMAVIRQGKGGMPSMMQGMPGGQGQLSDQDVTNVLAYLRALSSGAIAPEPTPTPRPPRPRA